MAAEDVLGQLLLDIIKIINLSLPTSHMPEKLKDAILSPIIKKARWIVRFSSILGWCQIYREDCGKPNGCVYGCEQTV